MWFLTQSLGNWLSLLQLSGAPSSFPCWLWLWLGSSISNRISRGLFITYSWPGRLLFPSLLVWGSSWLRRNLTSIKPGWVGLWAQLEVWVARLMMSILSIKRWRAKTWMYFETQWIASWRNSSMSGSHWRNWAGSPRTSKSRWSSWLRTRWLIWLIGLMTCTNLLWDRTSW